MVTRPNIIIPMRYRAMIQIGIGIQEEMQNYAITTQETILILATTVLFHL